MKFDLTSILRGLESEDVGSMRRVMNAIMHRLAGVSAATTAEMNDLDIAEHASMIWMYEATRNNSLLERMVTRFASARYGNSDTILKAARELDLVATEAVLNPDARPHRELVVAEGFFNQLVANGRAAYCDGADNEYGDIEPDSDDDERGPKNNRKRAQPNTAAAPNKHPRMGVSWSGDDISDSEETSNDLKDEEEEEEEEEEEDDDDISGAARKVKKLANKKHQAKRKHGERCIADENTDRDNAVVGRYNPSKLLIEFQAERPDPYNTERFIPADPVRFEYPNSVNWDDKDSIHRLNNWRLQVFKRTLGQKRNSRPLWTIREQNKLLELLDSHLKSRKTSGCYSRIDWKEIEQKFNSHFAEKTHKKGEKTAETSYNVRGKDMIAKSRKLVHDRPHTPRSAGAIENQLAHFTHPLAAKLVKATRKADNGDGDDSDDTHDDGIPKKGKGKGKAPAKKGKAKPNKVVKNESEEEEGGIEDVIIASRRERDRRERDWKSGGESSKRR